MRAHIETIQRFILAGACIGVFVAYVALYFPGYYTPDSIYIIQMWTGAERFANWHPPFVIHLWGWLFHLWQHLEFVWVTQVVLFILAARLAAEPFDVFPLKLAALLGLTLWPPLMTNAAALWRDNWAVLFTLAAYGFAAMQMRHRPFLFGIAAALSAALAVLTRVDYVLINLPVLAAACAVLIHRFWRSRGRVRALAVLAVPAAFIACYGIIDAVAFRSVELRLNPWIPTVYWDIVGASLQDAGEAERVVIAGETYDRATVTQVYNCKSGNPVYFGEDIALPKEPQALLAQWRTTIAQRFAGYLQHRSCVARQFFGWDVEDIHFPYPFGITPNDFLPDFERTAANIEYYWFIDANTRGWMWRYWVYVAAATGLLILSAVLAPRSILLPAVLYASLLAAAIRVLALPAADFRYGLWMLVATILLLFHAVQRVWSAGERAWRSSAKRL